MLEFHLTWHQQCKYFEVHARLVTRDLLDRLLALMAEVQQQRLHELLVQQMTRAVPVAVGFPENPCLNVMALSSRQTCSQCTQTSVPSCRSPPREPDGRPRSSEVFLPGDSGMPAVQNDPRASGQPPRRCYLG